MKENCYMKFAKNYCIDCYMNSTINYIDYYVNFAINYIDYCMSSIADYNNCYMNFAINCNDYYKTFARNCVNCYIKKIAINCLIKNFEFFNILLRLSF